MGRPHQELLHPIVKEPLSVEQLLATSILTQSTYPFHAKTPFDVRWQTKYCHGQVPFGARHKRPRHDRHPARWPIVLVFRLCRPLLSPQHVDAVIGFAR